jgi:hypothetical protein
MDVMKALFEMSDLGKLNYYLGIEVHQHSGSIDLCQSGYAVKILERSGMVGCNPCHGFPWEQPGELAVTKAEGSGNFFM